MLSMMDGKETAKSRDLTRWIMLAVLAWGLLLALGTYLFGGNHPELRAAVVAGCTLAFLGLWWGALAFAPHRQAPDEQPPSG
jgi:hypothetical protein